MPIFVADELVTAAKLNLATARDWEAWTPTYVNLTVGNGTVLARYIQVGHLIVARFDFTLGSTSSVGAATVSMPVTAASVSTDAPLGGAAFNDSSAFQIFQGSVRPASTTTFGFIAFNTAATYAFRADISATIPFTWATGDTFHFTAIYEKAA